MIIGREAIINQAISFANQRQSLFIRSVDNNGKTVLLRKLNELIPFSAYSGPKPASAIINNLSITLNLKKKRAYELKQELISSIQTINCVLLLDDVHEATKSVKGLVNKLLDHGLVIICAGKENVFNLTETRLNNLSTIELARIIFDQGVNRDLALMLANACQTPGQAVTLARKAIISNLRTRNQANEFIRHETKKKKTLTINSLFSIASILLSIKYLCYILRDYQTGYAVAGIAYVLISVYRLKRK
ncbi:MAG: hypothetical protein WC307_05920 [Candidatus Nanoarchaeia archaeon]|jgi:hypothetical protein